MNNSQNRDVSAKVALETLKILESGFYTNHKGATVVIKEDLRNAINNTVLYKPDTFANIENEYEKIRNEKEPKMSNVEITDETTISAAKRLVADEGFDEVVCLNFASAKNPGGGFLNGSQAQEESLARSSGLYPCISQMKEMYDYNWGIKTCLYSDYMIYSPKVPVFVKILAMIGRLLSNEHLQVGRELPVSWEIINTKYGSIIIFLRKRT